MPRLWDDSPEPKRKGKFEVYPAKGKEWRFRLKAPNGRIIAVSEGYKTKNGAINGAISVQNNAGDALILWDDEGVLKTI